MANIRFSVDEFVQKLALVNSVISIKNSIPILDDVRVETLDDGNGGVYATLTTSDSETWLEVKAPLIGGSDIGVIVCFSAKSTLNALRTLSGQEVEMSFDSDKHMATCRYENGHFKIPYEDHNEYPRTLTPDGEGAVDKRMAGAKMLAAIERTLFAVANDELRPIMNGVRFEFFADGLVAVASDGHKLAKYKDLTVTHNGTDPTVYGFTLPKKPCNILSNIFSSLPECNIKVQFDEKLVEVSSDSFKLTTRLIDGRYPNYDAVIPKDNNIVITINKGACISSLKRVMPMGNEDIGLIELGFDGGEMTISAENIDFSTSAREKMQCDYFGDGIKIGFKGGMLLQMLQSITTEYGKLKLKDSTHAGVLNEDTESNLYEYVLLLMPLMIR